LKKDHVVKKIHFHPEHTNIIIKYVDNISNKKPQGIEISQKMDEYNALYQEKPIKKIVAKNK
jgi:hypothetical protein